MTTGAASFASHAAVDVYSGEAPATRVNLEQKDWRHDFTLTFEASFDKGVQHLVPLQVFFPRQPGDAPDRWASVTVSFDLTDGVRTFDGVDKESCGTTWYFKKHFDHLPVQSDVWQRVAILSHDGYTSFYSEFEGRLYRVHTCKFLAPFQIAGLKIGGAKGSRVRNVKLRDFDVSFLPKGRAGFEVAKTPKTVDIPISGDVTRFDFVPGGFPVTVSVTCEDGTNACTASFVSFNQSANLFLYYSERGDKDALKLWNGGTMRGTRHIPDTGLAFSCSDVKIPIYTFPRLDGRYGYMQKCEMVTNQSEYGEAASRHVFRCAIRKMADGPRLYVDDNYCCRLPMKRVEKVSLRLPEGGCWRVGKKMKGKGEAEDEQRNGNPLLEPIFLDKPFDTSVCRVNMGMYYLECDGYLSRCPQECERSSFLRRIPLGTYLRARVRCKLGGDTNRNTCVTARITNFYSPNTAGRNNECIDQQTKEIPRGTKGEVELVFDFDPGKIQDVIWQRGFKDLTFEVLGDCKRRHEYLDTGYLHPVGISDVIVLAVTLERSPAGMCVENGTYGNMFLPSEKPGFRVTAEALQAGEYAIDWFVRDVYGNSCGMAHDALTLKRDERKSFRRTLDVDKPGWYAVRATLKDSRGRTLVTRDTSLVRLAPDTRKAGYESPWFTWTDIRANPCRPQDFTNAMELCWRAGIRHAQPGHYGETDLAKWGITLSPIPAVPFSAKPTLVEREADYERDIRKWMTRFPHASAATIFHENGAKTSRGKPPDDVHDREQVRKGTELCRVWRRLYPHVRLVVGNSGDGIDMLDQLFRAGFPKDLIDTMGEESVGGSMPPETNISGNFMALRDLALEYGYDKVWPEACYEWKTRQRRNFDSPRLQAAIIARDGIVGLAWGSRNITLSMSAEPDGCYFGGSWSGGSHSKNPECRPHPMAAAVATLTLVLDRCTFSRLVPTGSDTIYAVEFRDPDGRYVTALWTLKGAVKAKVAGSSRKLRVTELYGATKQASGLFRADVDVTLSEEPVYVTADAPLESVMLAEVTRDYTTFETYPGMEKAGVVAKPQSGLWNLDTKQLHASVAKPGGNYRLEEVNDAEKGRVLELTRGSGNRGKTVGGIRLKRPVILSSDVTTVGVWVKGNSSRGDIDFEIEDADGDIFHSTSRGWQRDYGEKLRLDFDGWRCIWMPLTDASPVRIHTLGSEVSQLWRCCKYVKTEMRWPIKLRGVSLSWGDEIVYINEKRPVKNQSVRIGQCMAF